MCLNVGTTLWDSFQLRKQVVTKVIREREYLTWGRLAPRDRSPLRYAPSFHSGERQFPSSSHAMQQVLEPARPEDRRLQPLEVRQWRRAAHLNARLRHRQGLRAASIWHRQRGVQARTASRTDVRSAGAPVARTRWTALGYVASA